MDLYEYGRRLQRLAAASTQAATESIVVPAANFLLASIKNRIMVEGRNTAGSDIGAYSQKAAYFTKEQFVKKGTFKGLGQKGFKGERVVSETKTKTVKLKGGGTKSVSEKKYKVVKKAPKSMYLEHGYKQLRDIQGRRTDKMNYNYTGDTMAAYQMKAKPGGVVLGITQERAAKIRLGLEKRRGKAFYATVEEIGEYDVEVTAQARHTTIDILKGNV